MATLSAMWGRLKPLISLSVLTAVQSDSFHSIDSSPCCNYKRSLVLLLNQDFFPKPDLYSSNLIFRNSRCSWTVLFPSSGGLSAGRAILPQVLLLVLLWKRGWRVSRLNEDSGFRLYLYKYWKWLIVLDLGASFLLPICQLIYLGEKFQNIIVWDYQSKPVRLSFFWKVPTFPIFFKKLQFLNTWF